MTLFSRTQGAAILVLVSGLFQALPAADTLLAPNVQQRLELLKNGYETFVLNNSTRPYEQGIVALNAKVTPILERAKDTAAQRADLDGLVRIKADLERLGKGEVLTDAANPPPEALKHTYAAYKLELEKLAAVRNASLGDAKRRYDTGLAKLQNEMTVAQEVEAALYLKQLRQEVAAAVPPSSGLLTNSSSAVGDGTGGENLLANGSFQKGTAKWEMTTHERSVTPKMTVDRKVLFRDKPTLRVSNPDLTDTHISQKVQVKPDTRYRLTGFIKAQDIRDNNTKGAAAMVKGGECGACIAIAGPRRERSSFVNTDTWTEVSQEFQTKAETVLEIECRLGYYGATVSGTAWFADVALTEVKPQTPAQAPALAASAPSAPGKPSVPQHWSYHMKLNDNTNLANIELAPDGRFLMSSNESGTWEQSATDGIITISFTSKPAWKMTLNGDGTAMLDRPDTGRRYMHVKR